MLVVVMLSYQFMSYSSAMICVLVISSNGGLRESTVSLDHLAWAVLVFWLICVHLWCSLLSNGRVGSGLSSLDYPMVPAIWVEDWIQSWSIKDQSVIYWIIHWDASGAIDHHSLMSFIPVVFLMWPIVFVAVLVNNFNPWFLQERVHFILHGWQYSVLGSNLFDFKVWV